MREMMNYTTDEQIEKMREELRQAKEKKDKKSGSIFSMQQSDAKRVLIKGAGWFFFIVIVLLLLSTLYSVLLAKSKGETPCLVGYQFYVVKSNSMAPTFKTGTVILSKTPEDSSKLNVGDIVTFKNANGAIVTHRIIEVIKTEGGQVKYRTKGDNPINSPDRELLDPQQILARVIAKIPLT
ncbi:MAG: signal peptidase I [Syntrophomonadaceae bacterium]|jgi:signal peptidase